MAAGVQQTKKFKERALSGKEDYEQILYEYITIGENSFLCAYDDGRNQFIYSKKQQKFISNPEFLIKDLKKNGLPTLGNEAVGIGFDMEENDDTEWKLAFSHLGNKMPNFKDVKEGKACLTDKTQVMLLFKVNIKTRRRTLKRNLYGEEWEYMTPNERLAVEDLYFNGGNKLVGKNTNFYKNFAPYIQAKREEDMELAKLHFEVCLWEVKYNSNPEKQHPSIRRGLQNRRNSEAIMLNTYDLSISKERNAAFLKKEMDALHKRREAEGMDDNNTSNTNTVFLQHVNMTVEGFIINIKGYLKQEIGKEDFLTEADISLVKSRAQVYLMAESVSNQALINIGQPIFDRIDKTFYPVQRKEQMKGVIGMMLGYLAQARLFGAK